MTYLEKSLTLSYIVSILLLLDVPLLGSHPVEMKTHVYTKTCI